MCTNRLALAVLGLAVAGLAVSAAAQEQLPPDARIRTGTLDNGLKWMWRSHDNPPGKFAIWVHVDSGSLNEMDAQRGVAHFLEHMAFNGTENFGPGELLPYFESIGMEFGPDVNAHTSFDETVYKLYLPDTKPETVDKGLMVLSDYVFRMLLLPEEIDQERGVILSELRSGMGAQQRLRDKFFEQVFAGTRLAVRLPIGVEEVISGATREQFETYYRTWYRPERMTLMVVADAEPEPYLPQLEKWFGQYAPERDAKPPYGPEMKPFTEPRAFVLSDPEYALGDVALYDVGPGRPPTTTVPQFRADLVEYLGTWIMDRRFSERVKKGEASYRRASASVFNLMNDAMLATASATGEPAEWEQMLEEVILEVNRAREHGFTAREFELAKTDLRTAAERAVETESTRNARSMISEMSGNVGAEEPTLAAATELELYQKLLPTITLDEVEEAFARHFEPGTFAYVLRMPEKEDVKLPAADEVLAAAKAAQARKTEAPQEEERETELLAAEPVPGKLVESTFDEDLEITSGWLANGARLHHRYMDYKKDNVWVSIALAGGVIEETEANVGITRVASLALAQPATSRLSSTEIEDIMTGEKVRVGGGGSGDAFVVQVSGSPADLETGLQLAHALLTDAKIEASAFDNWKKRALQQYEMALKQPQFVAQRELMEAISGGDPRQTVLLTPAQIEAQSVERSEAWLHRILRAGPIEVAVVGDMQLDAVLPLVEKYIGALPQRERQAERLEPLRALRRGAGPYERTAEVETMTPVAVAVGGFLSCDARDTEDVRRMNLARYVVDSRLVKRVREELGIVYSIGAMHAPGEVYRDSGLFISGAPCEPGKGPQVIAEIEAIFADFAASGPTEEELHNAKKQVANSLDTQLKEPSFWFDQLQHLDLHGLSLERLKNIEAAYEKLTAEDLKTAFAKYYQAQRTVRVVAKPASAPAQPQAEPEEEEAPQEAAEKAPVEAR